MILFSSPDKELTQASAGNNASALPPALPWKHRNYLT